MELIPDPKEKMKYPKSVWFIVLNELCERFNYYGLRTVLMLYLTTILKFNGDDSTIIYHSFVFLAYFMPLLGAIIADSYWGKFKTIMRLSIVYAVGNVVLTGASAADMFTVDVQKIIALLGLLLICVGTGGIKPCVLAFGGDQFKLPQQETQLQHYITHFVIAINVGSLVSTFLTPELRHGVHCFGKNTCFPLAFGVPAVLMFTAIAIFFAGKNMYVKKKPGHNVIVRTFGCLFYALRKKLTLPSSRNHCTHWLDHAKAVYTETEISETKTALDVITVFIAYPVFWALYEQQGSRWTLQATLMDGRLNFVDWTIKPDQMQVLVPFFGLLFLFLFDVALYPLLAKIGIQKPLQKLTLSGCLAIVAFVFAALLQFKIFGNITVIPPGEGRLNIYNGFDCQVYVRSPSLNLDHIRPLEMVNVTSTLMSREEIVEITFHFDPACTLVPKNIELNTAMTVIDEKEVSYYLISLSPNMISLNRIGNYDNLIKDKYGNPSLRVLTDYSFDYDHNNISLISVDDADSINSYSLFSFREMDYKPVIAGRYNLIRDGNIILSSVNLIPATLYTLTLQRNGDKMDLKLFTMDEGSYIHILWQLPQYLCMIMADVIFVVTSAEFAFTEVKRTRDIPVVFVLQTYNIFAGQQNRFGIVSLNIRAPDDIKSFISAISLLTTAIGNLLVVIISALSIKSQTYEYLLYAGIMSVDTLLLAYFSVIYRRCSITNVNRTTSNYEEKKEDFTVF